MDVAGRHARGRSQLPQMARVRACRRPATAVHIAAGFAHGFLTLEPDTDVLTRRRRVRSRSQHRLSLDDPAIGIEWPCAPEIILPRDCRSRCSIRRTARRSAGKVDSGEGVEDDWRVLVIEPTDSPTIGWLMESWNAGTSAAKARGNFVQHNHSRSSKGSFADSTTNCAGPQGKLVGRGREGIRRTGICAVLSNFRSLDRVDFPPKTLACLDPRRLRAWVFKPRGGERMRLLAARIFTHRRMSGRSSGPTLRSQSTGPRRG